MPSTAIRSFRYEPTTHQLFVTFVTGRQYVYDEVPSDVHTAFLTAPSRGRFFNTEIRDQYAYREITPARIKETAPPHKGLDRKTASRR